MGEAPLRSQQYQGDKVSAVVTGDPRTGGRLWESFSKLGENESWWATARSGSPIPARRGFGSHPREKRPACERIPRGGGGAGREEPGVPRGLGPRRSAPERPIPEAHRAEEEVHRAVLYPGVAQLGLTATPWQNPLQWFSSTGLSFSLCVCNEG